MSISSLVLRIRPETRSAAEAALTAFPGVECHDMSDDGKLIVTVEDAPGAAMSDTLISIHRIPEVLAATLAFESSDYFPPLSSDADHSELCPCEEAQP